MSNTKTDRLFDLQEPARKGRRASRRISKETYNVKASNFRWLIIYKVFNSIVHIMMGVNVSVALLFAFKATPVSAFHLHVGLCVIGYQLLMSNAILCLNGSNVWSSYIPLHYRVRAHMILHILGSVLATVGSIIMMMEKSVHFTTIHGKLALAALIFTGISLINGALSLLSNRRICNIKIAKIFHILCGIIPVILSSSCLTFGYYKNSFKSWASEEFALVMICVTSINTICVVLRPFSNLCNKLYNLIKTKRS